MDFGKRRQDEDPAIPSTTEEPFADGFGLDLLFGSNEDPAIPSSTKEPSTTMEDIWGGSFNLFSLFNEDKDEKPAIPSTTKEPVAEGFGDMGSADGKLGSADGGSGGKKN